MKKIISVLIVFSMILSCFAPMAFAVKVSTPIVFIGGQPDTIFLDKNNEEGKTINTRELPKEELDKITSSLSSGLNSPLSKALAGNWTEYLDGFYTQAVKYFEPLMMDMFGDPINQTGYDCLKEEVVNKGITGRFGLYDYQFIYDWRMDPIENAVDLNDFINEILEVTGKRSVSVVAQGIGASTLLAYLSQFGYSKISEIVFVNAPLWGSEVYGAMLADEMDMKSDQVSIFVAEARRNIALLQLLKRNIDPESWETLSSVKATRAVYAKIYEKVIPRIMREVFGTMPGFWSMIGDDYFNNALDTVFDDYQYRYDYQVVIEKANAYHESIFKNTNTILNLASDYGINIYMIANYGFHMIPVGDNSDTQSDIYVSVKNQTMGAISAAYNKTLGSAYIEKAKENDEDKYISPDGEIDASTSYAKDHTWFIKNLENNEKPACVDDLITSILAFSGYTTVFDLKDYPQYLFCSNDREDLSATTDTGNSDYVDNQNEEESSGRLSLTGFIEMIRDFIRQIAELVMSLIRFGQTADFGQWGQDTINPSPAPGDTPAEPAQN